MKRLTILAAAMAVAIAGSGAALAQNSGHGDHNGHAGHAAPAPSDSAATKAYRAINEKMHKDMDLAFTGDADADFVRGMIPHHQGAVDMAKIVLQYGKDQEIRKLAQEVVRTQESEIRLMRDWLAKRGVK